MTETIDGIIDVQFKELFEERGQPNELSEAFTNELFQRIQQGLIKGENNISAQRTTVVINNGRGLAEAVIAGADRRLTFAVAKVEDELNLKAFSQAFGNIDENSEYNFSLRNVSGNFVRLSLTPSDSENRVEIFSTKPQTIPASYGVGTWGSI